MDDGDYVVLNPQRASLESRLKIVPNYALNKNDKERIVFQKKIDTISALYIPISLLTRSTIRQQCFGKSHRKHKGERKSIGSI